MFEKFKAKKALYKRISDQIKAEEAKENRLKEIITTGINYEFIQDLINQARYDLEAKVIIPNGPTIVITRKDPYSKLQSRHDELF